MVNKTPAIDTSIPLENLQGNHQVRTSLDAEIQVVRDDLLDQSSNTAQNTLGIDHIEVRVADNDHIRSEAVDNSLTHKLDAYRQELARPIDDTAALSLLRRLAAHETLPKSQQAANMEQARKDFFDALGIDTAKVEAAANTAGRWTNLHVIPTDILGMAPTAVAAILKRYSGMDKVPLAATNLVLQMAVQAVGPWASAVLMLPMIEIQRQVREGMPKSYGASGAMDRQIANMAKETSTLKSLTERANAGSSGVSGTPQVDAQMLERQIERLELEKFGYDYSADLNKIRYTTYLPENSVRMLRATALVAGVWSAFAAAESGDKRAAGVPTVLLFQVVSAAVAWVAHWLWSGPARDHLMRNHLLDTDLRNSGTEIAKSLAVRQTGTQNANAVTSAQELQGLDEKARSELRGLWKGRAVNQVGMAAMLFKGEQKAVISEIAGTLGMDAGSMAYLVDLRAKIRVPVEEPTDTQIERLEELKAKMPAYAGLETGAEPPADVKQAQTLTYLTKAEEAEFKVLDKKVCTTRERRLDEENLANLEARFQTKRDALSEPDRDTLHRLERELESVITDQTRLKSGNWLEMDLTRKERLDSVLSGEPKAGTMALFSQYLFGNIAGDHDIVNTANQLADEVKKSFVEYLPFLLFKYGKSFQLGVGGSATALLIAAYNNLQAAQGEPVSMTWRIASSVVPLGVVFMAEATAGVQVNKKLMDRANNRDAYAYSPPSPGAKVGLTIKEFLTDIVCAPREGYRLASGAYNSSQASLAIENAKGAMVNLNARSAAVDIQDQASRLNSNNTDQNLIDLA